MESPLVVLVNQLDMVDAVVLIAIGLLQLYCALTKRISGLMFILVLSASLVSTAIPVIDVVASLVRWLSLLLLLGAGLLSRGIAVSWGLLLFWGYVLGGLISMFWARSIAWQFQRGLLLVVAFAAISVAYGARSYRTHRATLELIAIAGVVFALLNAASLPGQLTGPSRFTGFAKTAPALAVVLGGLLPFVFWGVGNVRSTLLRAIMCLGLVVGMVALMFSGQRAGTVAGIIGLIPLLFTTKLNRKNMAGAALLAIFFLAAGIFLAGNASEEKLAFLLSRYRFDAGLSNRDVIWQAALTEISRNPVLGHGIGAAEWVISSSFHSTYLEIWFNAGFLGLVLFLASQACFLLRIRHLSRTATDPEIRSILALALGYMLGFAVLCVFESLGAGISNLNMILYLYVGVLVSGGALRQAARPALSGGNLAPSPSSDPVRVFGRPSAAF